VQIDVVPNNGDAESRGGDKDKLAAKTIKVEGNNTFKPKTFTVSAGIPVFLTFAMFSV